MTLKIVFLRSANHFVGIEVGIAVNLYIALERMAILTLLLLEIYESGT